MSIHTHLRDFYPSPGFSKKRAAASAALPSRDLDAGVRRVYIEVPIRHVHCRACQAVIALAAYVAKQPMRLSYAQRLASGRSIGSGAVQGAIKQQVNLRMKRTGAREYMEYVGSLVELRAMSQTSSWPTLWTAA